MKSITLLSGMLLFVLFSCQKGIEHYNEPPFSLYTIHSGSQYSDQTKLEAADYKELRFVVKFDSSAIYKTINPENQADINKLYGFSDNDSLHHSFSARFGWAWYNDALGLYAYDYNDGIRTSQFLGNVTIGQEHLCSIMVCQGNYIFSLDGKQFTMPRKSTTPTGRGYKLMPYFGGDEFAPHDINIWIKEL